MQNNNIDFELEELRDTLVTKLLAMVIKNRENQTSINKCIDKKLSEHEEIIQELKNKNQQLEAHIDKLEKDLTNTKEVIYQIIGGIYNSETQKNNRDLHTEILYSTDLNIDKDQLKRENMWPTTRQGDENQERIQRIEEKLKGLFEIDGQVVDYKKTKAASKKYNIPSENCISRFINEKIEIVPDAHLGRRELNLVFKEWFQINYGNIKSPALIELEEAMDKKFEKKTNKNGSKEWINIKINSEDGDDDILETFWTHRITYNHQFPYFRKEKN